MKYENTFKAIDQILWKEQGCGSELDYLEQKSWMSDWYLGSIVGANGQHPRSATLRRARWCWIPSMP